MKHPRLLDQDHVLVKICGCSEHSLTIGECQKLRDHLNHAIRLLEYNQEPREVPNTVYCKVCNVSGKEVQVRSRLGGDLWGMPEDWGWADCFDDVLGKSGSFCACPLHKEYE